MIFSIQTLLDAIKLGGTGGILAFVLIALYKGWFVLGREVDVWKGLYVDMKGERDAYRTQVEARQSIVDSALKLAEELRRQKRQPLGEIR